MIISRCTLHPREERFGSGFQRPYSARVQDELYRLRVRKAVRARAQSAPPRFTKNEPNAISSDAVSFGAIRFVSKLRAAARQTRFVKRMSLMSFCETGAPQFVTHWSIERMTAEKCYVSSAVDAITQSCCGLRDICEQARAIVANAFRAPVLEHVWYVPLEAEPSLLCRDGNVFLVVYMHAETVVLRRGAHRIRNALVFDFRVYGCPPDPEGRM